MTAPVDANDVLMTGENSFIRLSEDGGKTITDRLSHWRVLWCPAGAGHALFMQSRLLGSQPQLYSDNPGVARWLQRTIEKLLYPVFADEKLPIVFAEFARGGDPHTTVFETVTSAKDKIRLTWWNCLPPFVLTMPPGFNDRPIGVFSTFFPARAAQVEMNGFVATSQPWTEKRGDRDSSSACLAWSETWVTPRK